MELSKRYSPIPSLFAHTSPQRDATVRNGTIDTPPTRPVLIRLPKRFVVANREAIREHVSLHLLAGRYSIVLDFTPTQVVDSSAFGTLIHLLTRTRSLGGWLRFYGVTEDVRSAIVQTKMGKVFPPPLQALPDVAVDSWVAPEPPEGWQQPPAAASAEPDSVLGGADALSVDLGRLTMGTMRDSWGGEHGIVLMDGQALDGVALVTEHEFYELDRRPTQLLFAPAARAMLDPLQLSDLFPAGVTSVVIHEDLHWAESANVSVGFSLYRNERVSFEIDLEIHAGDWKKPWSAAEYQEAMHEVASQQALPFVLEAIQPEWLIGRRKMDDLGQNVGSLMREWMAALELVHATAERTLIARSQRDSLVTFFTFPISVRGACEQYLLSFVEFLRDFGVEADAEIRHEASSVLFTVTPETNQRAHLQHIWTALGVYLDLPANPHVGSGSSLALSIEHQRVLADVQHLRGQLSLAGAHLQLSQATIDAQSAEIEYLRKLNSGEALKAGLVAAAVGGEMVATEPVLGSAVSVVPIEYMGVKVDLPHIVRRLKEMWQANVVPDEPPGDWF